MNRRSRSRVLNRAYPPTALLILRRTEPAQADHAMSWAVIALVQVIDCD
jgi:hypothetical protein